MKNIVLIATFLRVIILTALLGLTIYANTQNVAVNTKCNSTGASAILDVKKGMTHIPSETINH